MLQTAAPGLRKEANGGETVYRNPPQPGAIVTRLASSHIRVGSFQYLATQGDVTSLKNLADLAIQRHYPEINSTGAQRYLDFLAAIKGYSHKRLPKILFIFLLGNPALFFFPIINATIIIFNLLLLVLLIETIHYKNLNLI